MVYMLLRVADGHRGSRHRAANSLQFRFGFPLAVDRNSVVRRRDRRGRKSTRRRGKRSIAGAAGPDHQSEARVGFAHRQDRLGLDRRRDSTALQREPPAWNRGPLCAHLRAVPMRERASAPRISRSSPEKSFSGTSRQRESSL
jgi:hypothetical protein